MTTPSYAAPGSPDASGIAPAAFPATRLMEWSVRRELWENRSVYIAPVAVAAVMLFASAISVIGLPHRRRALLLLDPAQQQAAIEKPYDTVMMMILLTAFVVGVFYCLDALHGERRDRSILFWKSLPVSDTQTVLSKVLTAAVVIPVIAVAAGFLVSILLLLIIGIVFAVNGVNMFGMILSNANFYLAPLRMIGLLPVYLVWALPTIGWLLMVSAWARSKVFLWAVGTPVILVVVVKWANYLLQTGLNIDWLVENIVARGLLGLVPGNWVPLAHIDPHTLAGNNNFVALGNLFTHSWMTLATPQALIGAAAGVAMIVAAIRLRRWKDEG